MKAARVLITRPIEQAKETQSALIEMGIEADCQPFLTVEYHKVRKDISRFKTLIFTSGHAVRAFCDNYRVRDMAVYTVGDTTAALAIEKGFKNVHSASGSLMELELMLQENPPSSPILYACGRDISRSIKLPDIHEVIFYHADFIDEIDLKQTLSSYSHVLFYSVRTADSFVRFIEIENLSESVKTIKALCLAPSMVQSLSVLPWQDIEVASEPTQESLLELLKI